MPAPCTRGDGPLLQLVSGWRPSCSPHPRGWSLARVEQLVDDELLPAPTGMVPTGHGRPGESCSAPRTRGDGPGSRDTAGSSTACSPHPRGWSHRGPHRLAGLLLLPAPAGMVPPASGRGRAPGSAPRTRGDGPGWVIGRRPAHLCSPHPRGWSPVHRCSGHRDGLLPAPAGMVPSGLTTHTLRRAAPRTRGDGPANTFAWPKTSSCSPHPRGWSQGIGVQGRQIALLPAPAGMVPRRRRRRRCGRPAPRTRGDGPPTTPPEASTAGCSPHPRGWSLPAPVTANGASLLPAPAGMVPPQRALLTWCRTAPRTRGDGPATACPPYVVPNCSPHPRGWSQR